jgi:hypothetical protein
MLGYIWEDEVSEAIDRLVGLDVRYLAVQRAIERVIETGIILEYSVPIVIDDEVVYVHRVPEFFVGMIPLVVLYIHDENDVVSVLELRMIS